MTNDSLLFYSQRLLLQLLQYCKFIVLVNTGGFVIRGLAIRGFDYSLTWKQRKSSKESIIVFTPKLMFVVRGLQIYQQSKSREQRRKPVLLYGDEPQFKWCFWGNRTSELHPKKCKKQRGNFCAFIFGNYNQKIGHNEQLGTGHFWTL